jgi:hypothetical protein
MPVYTKDGLRREGAHVLVGTPQPLRQDFVGAGETPAAGTGPAVKRGTGSE